MQKKVHSRLSGRAVVVGCVAIAVAGCASKPLNVPYNPEGFGIPDAVPVAPVSNVIGPGDKIHVTVFQVESLSGDYQVEENGQVEYPLIGIVEAQGHTASEFAKILATRLGERNLRNPNVQVAIIERAQQTITIEGAVKQPAVVPLRSQTTLLRAIALGGGTADYANPSQVLVFRTVKGTRMAAAFDLRAIRRAEAADPPIYFNDIIVVGGSQNKGFFDKFLQVIPILGLFRPF